MQRYSLFSFSFLALAAIVVAAMAFDPKGFSIQTWQPLIASIVALYGASVVFRGARLAYQAAMAKVDLDRKHHDDQLARLAHRYRVRLRFAAHITRGDAEYLLSILERPDPGVPQQGATAGLQFTTLEIIEEAWQNLEVFPTDLASELLNLKISLLNFSKFTEFLGPGCVIAPLGQVENDYLERIRKTLRDIIEQAQNIRETITY